MPVHIFTLVHTIGHVGDDNFHSMLREKELAVIGLGAFMRGRRLIVRKECGKKQLL